MARKLGLSVAELLQLISVTGLDPFVLPAPAGSMQVADMIQLATLVKALRERSVKSAVALYLIWNIDLSGRSSPDPQQIRELGRTLRGDFADINEQFAAVEDPGGDIARARVALVYGQETADAFFLLLDDAVAVDVAYTHSASTLDRPSLTSTTDSPTTIFAIVSPRRA